MRGQVSRIIEQRLVANLALLRVENSAQVEFALCIHKITYFPDLPF
jgi:hypothetical protein